MTALHGMGHGHISVNRIEIHDPEHPDRVGFTGFPTVRVNGQDPFATGDETAGFACRVYTVPGGLSGSPTVDQFMEVFT